MAAKDNWNRLEELAKNDDAYILWQTSYLDCKAKYNRFLKWCPKKVRNYLSGYAECGRLMMQRMVNLACENMEFTDKK